MKKIVIVFILLGLIISCKNKEENFTDKMLEKLSVVDDELPSMFTSLRLYVFTNNGEILETNCNSLFIFYKLNYNKSFKTFKEFLDETLNNGFVIDKNKFKKKIYLESFRLNPKIEKEYNELGFDGFLKKYSKGSSTKNSDLELNKTKINEGEYESIIYLLYKNKFDISIDCHIGKDYIRNREARFKL